MYRYPGWLPVQQAVATGHPTVIWLLLCSIHIDARCFSHISRHPTSPNPDRVTDTLIQVLIAQYYRRCSLSYQLLIYSIPTAESWLSNLQHRFPVPFYFSYGTVLHTISIHAGVLHSIQDSSIWVPHRPRLSVPPTSICVLILIYVWFSQERSGGGVSINYTSTFVEWPSVLVHVAVVVLFYLISNRDCFCRQDMVSVIYAQVYVLSLEKSSIHIPYMYTLTQLQAY
jgi:hypothetical protein